MEKPEKLKSKRAAVRAAVTKLITKCDTLFSVDIDKTDCDSLLESLELVNEKEALLKELDSEIDELIQEKTEYEKELKSVEEYSEKISSLKFKIKMRLKKCKIETEPKVLLESSNSSKISNKQVSAVKLPKLNIEKFSGDASQFLEFFNLFTSAIDSNESLSKIEKFQYLKSLLSGPAYNIVAGFELTDQNYSTCLKLLEERYGKRENIINCYMNKILNLEPVKSSNNVTSLRKLYDNIETSIRNLEALGVTTGSYGHLLLPILLRLLPENLILDFHRKRDPDKDCEVTDLINFIKTELRCREATNLVNNSQIKAYENPKTKHENSSSKYQNFHQKKNIPSASALNTSTSQFCIFCKSSDHVGLNCSKFTDEQKRYKLKKEGRCYHCFYKSHLSVNCRTKTNPCSKCGNNTHSHLFCFKETTKENPEKEKKGAIVSMMSEQKYKQNKATLLQTCTVSVSAGKQCLLARVLCDSGSEKCFVKRSLVQKLKLKPLRRENLLVYPFGRRRPYEAFYDVVALELSSIVQPINSIKIEALVVDNITGASVNTLEPELLDIMRTRGFKPADTGLEQEIKILLGSDFLWRILKGIEGKLTKELYVAETIFGHTVQGQIESNKKEVACLRVSVENINTQLKAFWDLEAIGIAESNEKNITDLEVIKEFKENLKFVNGRYETKLLWKNSRELLRNNLEVAKKRFSSLENKFLKNDSLLEEYNSILLEQFNEGVIELCTEKYYNNSYYMPHRPVIRDDKITTKMRIDYDASSKYGDSLSLNESLNRGPNLNINVLESFSLSKEAVDILKEGGMKLRKFESNSEELKKKWVDENMPISSSEPPNTSLKILGLIWNNAKDKFGLELRPLLEKLNNDSSTTRNVLKIATMLFDPARFIVPFVIRFKCLLQYLWVMRLSRGESFSGELENDCQNWLSEIPDLAHLKIPWQYFSNLIMEKEHLQLHIFPDANPNVYVPEFLSLLEDQWSSVKIAATHLHDVSKDKSRKAATISCVVQTNKADEIPIFNLEKYSSLKKLYRVTAWVFRFISNIKLKVEKRDFSELSAEEMLHAENFWLKLVQEESFPEVLKSLKYKKSIPKVSNLLQLNPILSDEDLLLVRGRLQKSDSSFYEKHPVVIPTKHKLTEKIVKDAHDKVFHSGVSSTLVQPREKFWMLRSRLCIKSVLNKRAISKKCNARPGEQVRAPLKRILYFSTIKVNNLILPATMVPVVKCFRLRETLLNHFWKRLKNEYLLYSQSALYTDLNKTFNVKADDVVNKVL